SRSRPSCARDASCRSRVVCQEVRRQRPSERQRQARRFRAGHLSAMGGFGESPHLVDREGRTPKAQEFSPPRGRRSAGGTRRLGLAGAQGSFLSVRSVPGAFKVIEIAFPSAPRLNVTVRGAPSRPL